MVVIAFPRARLQEDARGLHGTILVPDLDQVWRLAGKKVFVHHADGRIEEREMQVLDIAYLLHLRIVDPDVGDRQRMRCLV